MNPSLKEKSASQHIDAITKEPVTSGAGNCPSFAL